MGLFGPETYGNGSSGYEHHGSLWAGDVQKRFVCSLTLMVCLDRRRTEKVRLFINTNGLFGPATYAEGLFVH